MTAILGLSAFYHDSAAVLVVDGEIIAAAQEERFTHKKHDPGFPINSIEYILSESHLTLDQVEHVAFYDKPFIQAPLNSQSFNRYSYVNNNPLSLTDPSGYFFKRIIKSFNRIIKNTLSIIKRVIKKIGKYLESYVKFASGYTAYKKIHNYLKKQSSFYRKYNRVIAAVVAAVVITVVSFGSAAVAAFAAAYGTIAAGAVVGAAAGFVSGYIATGTLKGALTGALTGAVMGGVGGYFQGLGAGSSLTATKTIGYRLGGRAITKATLNVAGQAVKATAFGIAGGTLSKLQGGSFKDGFIGAAVSAAFAGKIGKLDAGNAGFSIIRTGASAIIGGAVSKLAGGSFERGAAMAALMSITESAANHFRGVVGHDSSIVPGTKYNKSSDGKCCSYKPDKYGRPPEPNLNVAGVNKDLDGPWYHPRNMFKQGGLIGRAVNYLLPYGSSTSYYHDTRLNSGYTKYNVPTMPGAWVISSLAGPGKYFRNWDQNPLVWNLVINSGNYIND